MTKTHQPKSTVKRRGMIAGGAILAVAATGAVAWAVWPTTLPGDDATPDEVRAAVAADSFRDLPKPQRQELSDRLLAVRDEAPGEASTDEAGRGERRRAMRNAIREQLQKRMDAFFAAESEAERDAVLDEALDRFQEMRKEREARRGERAGRGEGEGRRDRGEGREGRGGGGGGPGGGPGGWDRGDPAARVQALEFFSALRNRAEERGIDMPGPGGRGRGGDRG